MENWLMVSIFLTIFVSFQYEVAAKSPLRIVNGTTAEEGEFPYMVQLQSFGSFICGGGIIGPEWILTAGHCVDGGLVSSIVYGTNKLYHYGDGHPNTSIKVKNWFQHPNFTYIKNTDIPIYDVGILQLEEPIPFSASAKPINLAEADAKVPFHIQGVLSGWGVNETWGASPPYLQKINLQLLTDEECKTKINNFGKGNVFTPIHHLCSDDYYNGECYGDSGSPYVINGTQYGLVSWSFKPCGIVPGTYSRITNPEYRNWIRTITSI